MKDGKASHITREPEQVKAFRDTGRDGIHSYLTYLRDRLTVARDLLTESGSIFVQIGDENVHRVRALMDEVFGEENCISQIVFVKTSGYGTKHVTGISDYLLYYAKNIGKAKYRQIYHEKIAGGAGVGEYKKAELPDGSVISLKASGVSPLKVQEGARFFRADNMTTQGNPEFQVCIGGRRFSGPYKTNHQGMDRLRLAGRLLVRKNSLGYKRYLKDFAGYPINNTWTDTGIAGRPGDKVYVVQTVIKVVERCILMSTDPGDLVLDPTCGSGTTAYVAEQWGRRWITIDTSRVALALARARIMGARYPYYILADSREGQIKEAEITGKAPSETPTHGDIRQGFVYQRVSHITLKSIANNTEIDVIWEKYEANLKPLREQLSAAIPDDWLADYRAKQHYDVEVPDTIQEWEIPRDFPTDWPDAAQKLHERFWEQRIDRQKEIDASIAAKADYEYLYDKPYEDKKTVRVAGPFTVESLSPHRVLGVDENDELIDPLAAPSIEASDEAGFVEIILDNLKTAGVQQAHKEDKIVFTSLTPWPGRYICAEGRYIEGTEEKGTSKRAAIFIGPEFGTVSRTDLVEATREAGDADFDVLIACAFNYDAHSSEFNSLGRIPVLKARMNADLHMAADLKKTTKGNLFVIFGEPDITVASGQWLVTRNGRMVANYDIVKELSGLGSLEEINRIGREGLSLVREISQRGEVQHDQSVTSGGGVGSGEHSRGRRTAGNEGVSPISERSERIAGGSGDIPDSGNSTENGEKTGNGTNPRVHCNRWSDAQRTQTISALENLIPADFPLSLTTDHRLQVTVHGVDVFDPSTGEVRSDSAEGIACWFIDTNYNEESFFVRQAYFLGPNDPYKALKTTLIKPCEIGLTL